MTQSNCSRFNRKSLPKALKLNFTISQSLDLNNPPSSSLKQTHFISYTLSSYTLERSPSKKLYLQNQYLLMLAY